MRRAGRIVAASGEGRAIVALEPGEACSRCARGRGCGAALFAPRGEALELECRLPVEDGASAAASVGTRVDVELAPPGPGWLVPVALAYALPTLGLVAGAFVPEPWTPLAALVGLVLGLLAWRASSARLPAAGAVADTAGPHPPVARIAFPDDNRPFQGDQSP